MNYKQCNRCGCEKHVEYFSKDRSKKDGRHTICKFCVKQKSKTLQERQKVNARKMAKRHRDPRISLHAAAKIRAHKKNIPFSIEVRDIVLPEFCPILKIPLKTNIGVVKFDSYSLDRVIPELGYTRENIWVISHLANTMKSSASIKDLVLFARWVFENFAENTKQNASLHC